MQVFVAVYAQFNANEKLLAESATSFFLPLGPLKRTSFKSVFNAKKSYQKYLFTQAIYNKSKRSD